MRSSGESGRVMQAQPPPSPAPGTSPRSFTPHGYESATPSPRSYKALDSGSPPWLLARANAVARLARGSCW